MDCDQERWQRYNRPYTDSAAVSENGRGGQRGVLVQTLEGTTSRVCRVCWVFSSVNISHPSRMCPLKKMPDYNFWTNFKDGKLIEVMQRFFNGQGQKKQRLAEEEGEPQKVDTGVTPEPFDMEYQRIVDECMLHGTERGSRGMHEMKTEIS